MTTARPMRCPGTAYSKRRTSRGFTVTLLTVLFISGCRSVPTADTTPELPLGSHAVAPAEVGLSGFERERPSSSEPSCVGLADDADASSVDGRYELVVVAVEAVVDGRCRPLDPSAEMCRALFLTAASDPLPAIGHGVAPELLAAVILAHRTALEHGVVAAQALGAVELSSALADLAQFDIATSVEHGPAALAELARARADPVILGPVVEAESACVTPPR